MSADVGLYLRRKSAESYEVGSVNLSSGIESPKEKFRSLWKALSFVETERRQHYFYEDVILEGFASKRVLRKKCKCVHCIPFDEYVSSKRYDA